MATENKWVQTDQEAGKKDNPALVCGAPVFAIATTFEVAAADDNGSVYKLARLPANAIPIKCDIFNDAIANSTDWDLGLYEEDGSTAVDVDVFTDGADINAGNALGSPANGLQTGPSIDEIGYKVWELAGHTLATKKPGYVLALTANAVGTAAGTVSVIFYYILG